MDDFKFYISDNKLLALKKEGEWSNCLALVFDFVSNDFNIIKDEGYNSYGRVFFSAFNGQKVVKTIQIELFDNKDKSPQYTCWKELETSAALLFPSFKDKLEEYLGIQL